MRLSAVLVGLALLLLCAQVAFSDGARPNLVSLPIGVLPATAGAVLLLVGLGLGLAAGTPRYRLAMALGLLGTALALFGLMFATIGGPGRRPAVSLNEIALAVAVMVWVGALLLAISALRQAPSAHG